MWIVSGSLSWRLPIDGRMFHVTERIKCIERIKLEGLVGFLIKKSWKIHEKVTEINALIVQLAGHEPKVMPEAAQVILERTNDSSVGWGWIWWSQNNAKELKQPAFAKMPDQEEPTKDQDRQRTTVKAKLYSRLLPRILNNWLQWNLRKMWLFWRSNKSIIKYLLTAFVYPSGYLNNKFSS